MSFLCGFPEIHGLYSEPQILSHQWLCVVDIEQLFTRQDTRLYLRFDPPNPSEILHQFRRFWLQGAESFTIRFSAIVLELRGLVTRVGPRLLRPRSCITKYMSFRCWPQSHVGARTRLVLCPLPQKFWDTGKPSACSSSFSEGRLGPTMTPTT